MKQNKNILILSTGDVNGAYEAAYRISLFAYQAGFNVVMLVKKKTQTDRFIIEVRPRAISRTEAILSLSKTILKRLKFASGIYPSIPETHSKYIFYAEEQALYYQGTELLSYLTFNPDLILSCLTNDFVNTQTLVELKRLSGAEVVVVTMDMIPFTGGCHYAWDCKGYETVCADCPAIIDIRYKDLAQKNLMIKKKNIDLADIKILAGAGWALNQARRSFLFRNQKEIYNINSCIDTSLFNNKNRMFAKGIFGFPQNTKVIFVGSQHINDERKGVVYAIEALNILWHKLATSIRNEVLVVLVGNLFDDRSFIDKINLKKRYIEYIKDYRLLSLLYQASNIFLCSSIEDAGPLMVSEALACGTPVVGFEMGVTSNMVINGYNGYKAELKNSLQLAEGLEKILSLSDEEFKTISENAVLQVELYSSQQVVVKAIKKLFKAYP